MLKELKIKNFMSFKDEVVFSMEADTDRVSEYQNHYVEICNNSILKIASMYGPNGGGKSNLIKALTLLNAIVTHNENQNYRPTEIKCLYSNEEEIEISAFFVDEKYEIGFNIVFKSEITPLQQVFDSARFIRYITNINIISESVIFREKDKEDFELLYERDEFGTVESEKLLEIDIKLPSLSKSKTVLSKLFEEYANTEYIVSNYIYILKSIYKQIDSIKKLDMNLMGTQNKELVDKYKDKLINLLNSVDIKINDIKTYTDRESTIYFERMIKINDKDVKKEIAFSSESDGTKKIFKIFLMLLLCENENIIFVCDDMNSFLHPKLFKAVIEYFSSSNNNTNQLIFNSHDILNMTNELFRRDEIWFVYRDENYSSKLIALSNLVNYKGEQIRKDAKYYKQYLEGRYGADPFIAKGLGWND